ncbi:hypothetical protein C8J57DRAFT_1298785 [Mycena rebaudengoi]|nr:hypothetical protein C8J57DRAFT_1298785 [Mycena rebaudengoi]
MRSLQLGRDQPGPNSAYQQSCTQFKLRPQLPFISRHLVNSTRSSNSSYLACFNWSPSGLFHPRTASSRGILKPQAGRTYYQHVFTRYLALTVLALCAPVLADLESLPSGRPTQSSVSVLSQPSLSLSIPPISPGSSSTRSENSISGTPNSASTPTSRSTGSGSSTSKGSTTSGSPSTTSTGAARATGLGAEGFAMAGAGLLAAALI